MKPQAPRPLSPKREAYIEGLASGLSSQQAALKAGFSPSYAKAVGHRLGRLPAVQAAVAEVRKAGREAARYGLVEAMQEAQQVIEFAKAHRNAMAFCKAVELRTRLSGLLIERVAVERVDLAQALADAKARVRTVIQSEATLIAGSADRHNDRGSGSA